MADNPFYVAPPDIMKSLMFGAQGYDQANKAGLERDKQAARADAAAALAAGRPQDAISKLVAIDPETASHIASITNANAGQSLREREFAQNTTNANREYALKAETPVSLGADLYGGEIKGVRNPNGSYARINPNELPPVGGETAVSNLNRRFPDINSPETYTTQTAGAAVQRQPVIGQSPLLGAQQPQQPQDLTGDAFLNTLEPGQRELVRKIANYEINPNSLSVKGGHRERVLGAVSQYDPSYDQRYFASSADAVKKFATGPQGNTVRSFDVAIDHLDTLGQYSQALANGDVNLVNKVKNKLSEEFGGTAPTNFDAIKSIVGAEVSKAIVGSQGALQDREELRNGLLNSRSPEQLAGVIKGYQSLMAGQLKGLKQQYEASTGLKNFDNKIRSRTKDVLMGTPAPGAPAPVGTPGSAGPPKVTDEAGYSQIQSGQQYIAPDGSLRTKR